MTPTRFKTLWGNCRIQILTTNPRVADIILKAIIRLQKAEIKAEYTEQSESSESIVVGRTSESGSSTTIGQGQRSSVSATWGFQGDDFLGSVTGATERGASKSRMRETQKSLTEQISNETNKEVSLTGGHIIVEVELENPTPIAYKLKFLRLATYQTHPFDPEVRTPTRIVRRVWPEHAKSIPRPTRFRLSTGGPVLGRLRLRFG